MTVRQKQGVPYSDASRICLWNRKLKVEALDTAAASFSLWQRDYFTAATIVTLLALGECFEKLRETKTKELLNSLFAAKQPSSKPLFLRCPLTLPFYGWPPLHP